MTKGETRPRGPVIDCFVNPVMPGADEAPHYLRHVLERYFGRVDEALGESPIEELLTDMDDVGITRAVITCDAIDPEPQASLCRALPDRFTLSAVVDPRTGMAAVRAVESVVRDHGCRLVRMFPFLTGLAPNDRCYYPIYAKCVELSVPVSVTTGIPGPPLASEPQRPLHLDDVCIFFPELVVVMAHGADPWWGEAIRLMLKYENLFMMTSAYAPKYLPGELIHFMNTRGGDKVLFASDHPVLSFRRCVAEARALQLEPRALESYLFENANRVLAKGD